MKIKALKVICCDKKWALVCFSIVKRALDPFYEQVLITFDPEFGYMIQNGEI